MKTMRIVLAALAVLALAMLACSLGGAPKSSQDQGTGQQGQGQNTQSQGNALSLSNREAGLDTLKSYRMKWQAEWSTTDNGKTDKMSWNLVEEYSSNPAGLHWTMQVNDPTDKSKTQNSEMWQVGNTTYMKTVDDQGKSQCMSFSNEDKDSQLTKGMLNPGELGSIQNAKYVGDETVNGIKAKHYKYDEKSANLFGAGQVSGDIWVAIDGGYVVKDSVNWKGGAGLGAASGSSTTMGDGKWTLELSDVNQNMAIKPPENCGGAANSLPLMKDATEKSSFGDTTMYKTASKIADVVAFYKAQMPAAGWKLSGDPQVTEDSASMEFKKGDQTAQVLATTDQGKTQVMIMISK